MKQPAPACIVEGMTRRTALIPTTVLLLGMPALSGCSAVDGILHKQSTQSFDDLESFRADAAVDAGWVPSDATDITVRTSTLKDAADAVVLVRSAEASLPGDCVAAPRTSAPAWVLDDAPSAYEADEVWVCGNWSVIPAEDGWYGWTPNSDEEQQAARS
jgi:hypothetical protein